MWRKVFHIALTLVAAITLLSSCSHDNDIVSLTEMPQGNIVVTVNLDGDETMVDNLVFITFDKDGKMVTVHTDRYEEGKRYSFATYQTSTHLLVLANVDNTVFNGDFTTADLATSKDWQLKNITTSTHPFTGNTSITFSNDVANVESLVLTRAIARIGFDNISINVPAYKGTFTPTEVFAYSVNDTHYWYDTDNLWGGRDDVTAKDGTITGERTEGGDTLRTFLGDRLNGALSLPNSSDGKTKIIYYVYPHGFGNPTKLVVKGYFTDLEGKTTIDYYPIIVNHVYDDLTVHNTDTTKTTTTYTPDNIYPDDSKIEANKIYMISLNIVGKGLSSPADNWRGDDRSISDVRTSVMPWSYVNDTINYDPIR